MGILRGSQCQETGSHVEISISRRWCILSEALTRLSRYDKLGGGFKMEGFSRCLSPPNGCEARPLSNNMEFILSPCDTRRSEGSGTEKSIDSDRGHAGISSVHDLMRQRTASLSHRRAPAFVML